MKLNVDGSGHYEPHVMEVGGLIRDGVGRWLFRFARHCGLGNPLLSKLFALEASLRSHIV